MEALSVAKGEEARAGLEERRVGVRVGRREAAAVEVERDAWAGRGRGDAEHGVEGEGVRVGEDAGQDGDGVAERGSAGAEGGEVEEELLGEERVGEGHAGRTERARVDLLGDGHGWGREVEAEERDAVARRRGVWKVLERLLRAWQWHWPCRGCWFVLCFRREGDGRAVRLCVDGGHLLCFRPVGPEP